MSDDGGLDAVRARIEADYLTPEVREFIAAAEILAEPYNETITALRADLAAAEARAEVAERECADLWDALVDARDVIDEVLAKVRKAGQGESWRAAAAAVNAAARRG